MNVDEIPGGRSRPKVWLIGQTTGLLEAMQAASGFQWVPDDRARSTESMIEFAGRACYQSWAKPNPATARNVDYIRHLLEVGHLSVLEHSSATFYLTGVSRSFTHELVRHRHLSYSQLSQRYVPAVSSAVEPDIIAQDPELHELFEAAMLASHDAYTQLLAGLQDRLGTAGTGAKKAARQAARAVLPNAAETRIVVTGNYRAWRHFIRMRATEHADVEIREVAVAVLRRLQTLAPHVFADFEITELVDGTEVAASILAHEGDS